MQFYHRRVAWLAIRRYDRALLDADHTPALMDFVRRHAIDAEYVDSHEGFRGLVLYHRTQAAEALTLERRKPEGVDRLSEHHERWLVGHKASQAPNATLVEQPRRLEHEIRKNFAVAKTLREQFDEAVTVENYELAASLRDKVRSRLVR